MCHLRVERCGSNETDVALSTRRPSLRLRDARCVIVGFGRLVVCESGRMRGEGGVLFYQHAVAVGEEVIAVFDCEFVGIEDCVGSREGTDEHQQRTFRGVEIREDLIDDLELVARIDEDSC